MQMILPQGHDAFQAAVCGFSLLDLQGQLLKRGMPGSSSMTSKNIALGYLGQWLAAYRAPKTRLA